MSDRTEEPTPKRLRKAEEEGQSALSTFASQSVGFVAAVAIAPSALALSATRAGSDLRAAIAVAAHPEPAVAFDAATIAGATLVLVAPVLGAAAAAAAVASVIQTGGVIATKRLIPRLDKLDPVSGFAQLFSATRLVAILRAALFAAATLWFGVDALRTHAIDLAHAAGSVPASAALAATIAVGVATRVGVVGLFLGVADIVVSRRAWKTKLMMTKAEVKREHKESEGDPAMKAARERAHHELLASATIGAVRNASVVVVNPTHIACALRYDEQGGDEAPVVVATGRGELAARIVEAARQYGVPVLRDVPLAQALALLEIGDAIPEALYEAVAEILREAYEEVSAER